MPIKIFWYDVDMKTMSERFKSKYKVNPGTGCWEWFAQQKSGYGFIRAGGRDSQQILAHRASWLLFRGELPTGSVVMHKCDNRICVNPDHLDIGTQRDNMQDMVRKGRSGNRGKHGAHAYGERQGSAKLTSEQAREIFLSKGLYHEIGARFGTTKHTVFRIKNRTQWRRATEGLTLPSQG